jgi:hypothetical protein
VLADLLDLSDPLSISTHLYPPTWLGTADLIDADFQDRWGLPKKR